MTKFREWSEGERPDAYRASLDEPMWWSQTILLRGELESADMERLRSYREWDLACRVAVSKGLCKSALLPRFLLYVCERSLLGKADEITEQRIGTKIFNRPADYNPGEDNIVRSYARMLRKRLDEYFEGEGRDEPLRIVIPRGRYLPIFEEVKETPKTPSNLEGGANTANDEHSTAPMSETLAGGKGAALSRWKPQWPSIVLGLLIGALVVSAAWAGRHLMRPEAEGSAAHAVWAQMFQRNRNTIVVVTDSGLGILQNLTGHLVDVEEYANGDYLTEMKAPPELSPGTFSDLQRQRYTSVVSLDIASMLTRLPEFIANRTQVRYARGITAEDIKHSNIILLGSKHTDPWVSLFEKRLNFRFEYTPEVDMSYVSNEHPSGTEQKIYRNGTDATSNHTYGSIAYLPGLDGVGHALIIQGLNMAATQAAADTLFDANLMKPVLEQAKLPGGGLKPFELLVETTSIGATAPGSQVVAMRVYSPN